MLVRRRTSLRKCVANRSSWCNGIVCEGSKHSTVKVSSLWIQPTCRLQRDSLCGDAGSGTGYLTVCMALMVAAGKEGGGTCVGIDCIQGLVDLSRRQGALEGVKLKEFLARSLRLDY